LAELLRRESVVAPEYDYVFVTPPRSVAGWILSGICAEIAERVEGKYTFVHSDERLPSATVYFFSHYAFFRDALLRQPWIQARRCLVFYTHPKELAYSEDELIYVLGRCHRVISMCQLFADRLIELGLSASRIEVATIGADPTQFQFHERGSGRVGFCSAYYPRKRPDRVMEIVKLMPDVEFRLLGRGWDKWERFPELCEQKNFQYVECDYSEYPSFYREIDVLVSPAVCEGGPVPLMEAMMSNCVPVASRTGIALDIVRPGENGFLFDVEAPTDEICELIREALYFKGDVRATVSHLTWDRFAEQVRNIAKTGSGTGEICV